MSLSIQPASPSFEGHIHLGGEICPMCEQMIPNDRLEQVKARYAEHHRELESQYALKAKVEWEQLIDQLRRQKDEALAKARLDGEAKEAAARADGRKAATSEMETKLSAVTAAAHTAGAQAEELKKQLEASNAATAEKVSEARADAIKQTEAALQANLAAAQSSTQAALDQVRSLTERDESAQSQIARLKLDVSAANEEGKKAAGAELQARLTALSAEKQAAIDAKTAVEQQIQALRHGHEKTVSERVQEAREALEKSHRECVNTEQAKHFEERQKIQNQLEDVQRQLANKSAQELGEGAEVILLEALKAEFPDDDITRVAQGVRGADIRHKVRHNGKDCGLILYDSKNHKAWRGEFVTKLRDDQIADKADYAILSTIAFPQGTKQVHMQDGVIVANPARVVSLVKLVRQFVVRVHSHCLSNEDREEKALALHDFITSERFNTLLAKLHATADSLAELDNQERTAHNRVWQRRGQLVNGVAKSEADLRSEIDRIIGTADDLDTSLDEIVHGGAAATPE